MYHFNENTTQNRTSGRNSNKSDQIINPRTLTMGVIYPEEFYGGHFQIDLPLPGGFQSKE